MSRGPGVAISALVADMPVCTAIFIKICGHFMMRLSSTMSGGSSLGSVGVIPVTFSVFGGKKLHQFLILSDNLLYNFCTSC